MSGFSGISQMSADARLKGAKKFDFWLLLSALILLGFGLASLYSEGHYQANGLFFKKQLLYVVLGIVPASIFAFVKPSFWMRSANWLYALNISALLLVLVHGSSKNGAERWIQIGPIQFQPSEMAKILTILTLSAFYATRSDRLTRPSTFFLGILHVLVPMILIVKQPHLGATLVIGAIWFCVSLVAKIPMKYLLGTVAVAVGILAVAFLFPKKIPFLVHGYQVNRIGAFYHDSNPQKQKALDYQTNRAKIAFGVGGVIGTGFGKGDQGDYIPEQESDFIFTVPGEELGLVGCTVLLAAFGFLFYRIWLVGWYASEPFERMVSIGVLGMLVFHTFVNLFMVLQLLPVIGLWLPFMSYGGTAVWLCMSSVALVLNIRSRERSIV